MVLACPLPGAGLVYRADVILAAIDCHIESSVGSVYGRLFGDQGYFALVVNALLTLYLAIYALRLMTGSQGVSLSDVMPRVLLIGVVLSITGSWPAYHALVFNVLTNGPDELVQLLLDGRAIPEFGWRLQQVVERLLQHADIANLGGERALFSPANLLFVSAIGLLIASLGVLIIAKLVLGLLLALGPVFAGLLLFHATRTLLQGWLRVAVLFALQPLVILLSGHLVLTILEPLTADLGNSVLATALSTDLPNQPGPSQLPPAVLICLVVGLYLLCLSALLQVCSKLIDGWQLFQHSSHEAGPTRDWAQAAASAPTERQSTSRDDGRVDQLVHQLHTVSQHQAQAAPGAPLPAINAVYALPAQRPIAPTATSRHLARLQWQPRPRRPLPSTKRHPDPRL